MEPVSPARWLAAVVAGMVLGLVSTEAWLFRPLIGDLRWLGMIAGAAIGALAYGFWHLGRRVNDLEQQLKSIESPLRQPVNRLAGAPATSSAMSASPTITPAAAAAPLPSAAPRQSFKAPNAPTGPAPSPPTPMTSAAQNFLTSNLPVKIGILVLFVGLVALLRYASDQGWLSMPIEFRLSGIALFGIVGLVFGWQQREVRRVFGLSLQGGAIGVLMLTIFAAFRFYPLLDQGWALGLTGLLIAGGSVLAVVQHARGLALLAMTAGFAAPLLLGNDAGGPFALFAWYTILNLGLFTMTLARDWPLLIRLGFIATFVLSTLWGVLNWQPENYRVAQGFLIAFFALYFLIPIIQAVRHGPNEKLDILLVFGLPLLAMPLQIALLGEQRMAIAYSALIGSAIYLASALALIKHWKLSRLGRAHAVLAAGLATLAVPFAFSGPTLVIIWALEGAALVWFGTADQRRLARLSGLVLIMAATAVWLLEMALTYRPADTFIFNSIGLGGLALVMSLWLSAWRYETAAANSWRYNLLFSFGFLIWAVVSMHQIQGHFGPRAEIQAFTALNLVSLILTGLIHWRRRWALAGLAAVISLLSATWLALSLTLDLSAVSTLETLFWIGIAATAWMLDRYLALSDSAWRARISIFAHLALLVFLVRLALYLANLWSLGEGWHWFLCALPLLGLVAWLLLCPRPPLCARSLPNTDHRSLAGLAVLGLVLGLLGSLASSGASAPIPWIPLFNPLEITQLLGLSLLVSLILRPRAKLPELPLLVPASLLVLIATASALRAVHQLTPVAWDPASLAASELAQASVSVTWTVLGVIAWVAGSRRSSAALWRFGALLLTIVLIKLVLIDRQFLSSVAGILSFVAFGLLSILVGYLAPAPPSTSKVQRQQHDDDPKQVKL